jgi:two-component system, OmpR family, phosphate regulon response regulator PhoB
MNTDCVQGEPSKLNADVNVKASAPSEARRGRILVVEDDRHIARLLDYVLTRAGYDLRVVHTAENALIEMADCRPDALLLDLVLPGMTGLEFLRTIRAAPRFSDCVVIVLSGQWVEQDEARLAEAGASAQCSKPIAPSTLLRKLQAFGVCPSMPSQTLLAERV